MANKRVSELVNITAAELTPTDLLLLADIAPNAESKKLQLAELSSYLLSGGNLSGSFFGTASWADRAVSASYAPTQASASFASVAALALSALTASHALFALSASWSLSGSHAITASYALTSSVQMIYSSAFADYARSASYLIYTPTLPNGTASYAISASWAPTTGLIAGTSHNISTSFASASISASWVPNLYTQSLQTSASWASASISASYALVAANFPTILKDYGIHQAITQSLSSSQIDSVLFTPLSGTGSEAVVKAWGTFVLPITNSVDINGVISLIALERASGITTSLDSTPVYSTMVSAISGSLKLPFSMAGTMVLNGSYMFFVTSSGGVWFESSRRVRFNIGSYAEDVDVSSAEIPVLKTDNPADILTFTSSLGGPATDIASNIATASAVTVLDISAANSIHYVWTLPSLIEFICRNTTISSIGGMPQSVVTMSVFNNNFDHLYPLNHTALSILDCSDNELTSLPALPNTMSYLDFSNNQITSLPSAMPYGLTQLYGSYNDFVTINTTFPTSIVSMSFNNNNALVNFLATLPTSLTSFNVSACGVLTAVPTIPSPALTVLAPFCNLTPTAQYNIANDLVTNGQSNGTLTFNGNQALTPGAVSTSLAARIVTLQSSGWTVTI